MILQFRNLVSLTFIGMIFFSPSLPAQTVASDLESTITKIRHGSLEAQEAARIGVPCPERPSDVDRQDVSFSGEIQLIVVQAYSVRSRCDDRAIILFRRTDSGLTHVQTILLHAYYGEQPVVTFPELIKPGEREILIRGQIVDKGTGIEQRNITIYKFTNGRFEVVFDAPEIVHFEIPGGTQLYQLNQKSSFEFVHSGSPDVSIQEKQVITRGRGSTTRYRGCTWSPELLRFRCYERAPVARIQ